MVKVPDGTAIAYRHAIVVPEAAIDEHGHVNNAVYLTWVQTAITAFWIAKGPADLVADTIWVAHRHDITYCRSAILGDGIVVTVQATGYSGSRAYWRTTITRSGEVVAVAETTLVCLDRVSRRVLRVRGDVAQLFFEGP